MRKQMREMTSPPVTVRAFSSNIGEIDTAKLVRNAIYKRDRDQSICSNFILTFCMRRDASITNNDSHAAR